MRCGVWLHACTESDCVFLSLSVCLDLFVKDPCIFHTWKLSVRLSVSLCLSVCLSKDQVFHTRKLSVHVSVCTFVSLFLRYLSLSRSCIYTRKLLVRLSVCLYVCQFVLSVFACLYISLSVCLFVWQCSIFRDNNIQVWLTINASYITTESNKDHLSVCLHVTVCIYV